MAWGVSEEGDGSLLEFMKISLLSLFLLVSLAGSAEAVGLPMGDLSGDCIVNLNDGQLSNGGEKVEISMPGDVDGDGVRQYIRIDRVNYDDEELWPITPDGYGASLSRLFPQYYGNDPNNWQAAAPTPGQ